MGFLYFVLAAAYVVFGTILAGMPSALFAQEPAVPPESVILKASKAAREKPVESLSESMPHSASLPPSGSFNLPSPTPAFPISSLFMDAIAVPSNTPTPTPPPEAFATPVLVPASMEPTPPPPGSKTSDTQTISEDSSLPALESNKKTTRDRGEEQPTPLPSLLITTPSPLAGASAASPTAVPSATPNPGFAADSIPESRKLDLNSATEQELMSLPGIDAYRARLIILHRQAILGFARTDQLMDVYGISEQIFRGVAPFIRVGDRSKYSQGTLQTEIPPVQPLAPPLPPEFPKQPQLQAP